MVLKMTKLLLKLKRIVLAAYYTLLNIYGKLFKDSSIQKVWLFSERGFDARDNSYHLFKWVTQNHPEIRAYYVINPSDTDYSKVKQLGPTVKRGSFQHFRLIYEAEALISTHAYGWTPDMVVYAHLIKMGLFKPKGKQIFLQHGVCDKDTEWLYRKNFKPDLFLVSTYPEKILVNKAFEQPDDVIAFTGLPRFDTLVDAANSGQILFMPTWRAWLQNCSQTEFLASDYYKNIEKVLMDKELNDYLLKNNLKLLFYPHIEMQKYMNTFQCLSAMEVLDATTADVQNLLITSQVLITDYSSVYSDFLYMNKPVMFYQWDRNRFCTDHYHGLTVDHRDFGPVIQDEHDLQNILHVLLLQKKVILKEPLFKYIDTKNCQRVYEAIITKIEK